MSGMLYKCLVWTRCRAPLDEVVDLVTDPSELAARLPPMVRWDVSDPEGLRAAWRTGTPARFATRMRTPLGIVDWPLEVTGGDGGLRYTDRVDSAWFDIWIHRHRLERAIGGRVRIVDELVLRGSTRAGPLAVVAVERVLIGLHRRLGADLQGEPQVTAVHRRWRLGQGNTAHAEAALSELPAESTGSPEHAQAIQQHLPGGVGGR